ncbi:hypothetical protein IMCC1989_6 [gamma proteobacterium IMCC1989]|nr:hypothetical protein IMCC1989_6 [gamma proteobacterium IMCC1989]
MSRLGKYQTLQKTSAWIEEWYGDISEVVITEVSIPIPTKENIESYNKNQAHKAKIGKQTPLHAFIKYVAHEWLSNFLPAGETPRYETSIYLPIPELIELLDQYNIKHMGNQFNIREAFVIPKTPEYFDASNGEIIIADVYCKNIIIEVGYTTPFNLCMPLVEGLVSKSIWLPFPKGLEPNNFNPSLFENEYINGFQLSISSKA